MLDGVLVSHLQGDHVGDKQLEFANLTASHKNAII